MEDGVMKYDTITWRGKYLPTGDCNAYIKVLKLAS